MFRKFLPQEPIFFDLFEQQAKIVLQAAQAFYQMTLSGQIEQQEGNSSIKVLEHQADQIAHACIENLRRSFITPLQPDDIFHLITRMDDIIDSIDEACDNYLIYRLSSFTPAAQQLTHLLVLATEKLEFNIKHLRDREKQAAVMRETNLLIHRLENDADKLFRETLGQLFDEEQDIRLLIKWKSIYEVLENAMDYCEDVSNIIEGIILEYD